MISYEYPLSERVRTLLRLEDLFERVDYFLHKNDPHEHHVALLSIFEILEVSGRADLKSDLLQELERQKHTLESLRENPDVSEEALDNVLWQIDQASSRLFQASGKIGQELRENEWLMSITPAHQHPRRRMRVRPAVIPLLAAAERRSSTATTCSSGLRRSCRSATRSRSCCGCCANRGKTTSQIAYQGVYQQMMAGRMSQMLRIRLKREYHCVPEISANKYALNIRFTTQEGMQRPKAAEADVEFELTFCNL